MKYSRFLYSSLLIALVFCVPGGEYFGTVNEFRDSFAASQNFPVTDAGGTLFLFEKQDLPFSQIVLKGRNQFPRLCRMAVFLLFLLSLAALSRSFICICKLFRFYTRIFFDDLVKALLLGGQAPPLHSFS
jgi:hypothetical protein